MMVELYEQLRKLEEQDLIAPHQATRIYATLTRELRSPHSHDEPDFVSLVAEGDSRYTSLPPTVWKRPVRMEITPNGVNYVVQQLDRAGKFRNIGPESTAAIQLAYEQLPRD